MIEEAAGDAAALGCLDEVVHCRAIVADGTSADAQLAIYRQWRDKGAEREEALAAVTEWLAETTLGRDGSDQHRRSIGALPGLALIPSSLRILRMPVPVPIFAADLAPSSVTTADVPVRD